MKVILTQEVLGLGDPGEVVEVKNGYGRNYLVPRGIAIEATKHNIKLVEAERLRIQKAQAKQAEAMRAEADKLMGVKVEISARAGEGNKLYGSVTNMQIAQALAEQGHEVDRRRIQLAEPIKALGKYDIKVKLHPHVFAEIQVTVSAEIDPEEEARAAAKAAEAKAKAEAAAQAEAVEAEEAEAAEEAGEEA